MQLKPSVIEYLEGRRGGPSMIAARMPELREFPWGALLVLSVVFLLPSEALFNVPMGIMTILGAIILVREWRSIFRSPAARLMLGLFGCIWLPMLVALPDALDIGHAALTALKFLRFPLAGIFMLLALRTENARRLLLAGVSFILLAWCLDASWQLVTGRNIFGDPISASRLTGVFHPKYRLGIVLAAFCPIHFELVRRLSARRSLAWLLAVPIVAVIILSGSRAAWIMLLVALVGYGLYAYVGSDAPGLGRAALWKGLLIAALALGAASQFPPVLWRAKEAAGILSGDLEAMDIASKRRLSIWSPAIQSFKEHWMNGVGPRGFRDDFLAVAPPDNFWMQHDPPGVTHPHLMLLEIATETGSIGLAGLGVFFALVLRSTRAHSSGGRRSTLVPLALCIVVAMFPLNVHMAFYGSYWSTIYFWLTIVFTAHLQPVGDRAGDSREPSSAP